MTEEIIDPGENGVILSWQRCCRNDIINNIIAPGNTGFTAWTTIPPKSIPNNSAFFEDIPPIYVCVDAPLEVSQKAIDPDGDSLVYSFTTPYLGGYYGGRNDEFNNVRPNRFGEYDAPPFKNILWSNGYNQNRQIKGSPELFIDAYNGMLTVTPSEVGVYVVGIQVDEYRDGKIIGTTRRDYQISVIQCDFNVLTNFRIKNDSYTTGQYAILCTDTVDIENLSYIKGSAPAKYFWDFGDPTTTSDTLTTFDPIVDVQYVYPKNGDYTVTLTVSSEICTDIYSFEVRIRKDKPFELGPDKTFCGPFNQLLDTRATDAKEVKWNTGSTNSNIFVTDIGQYDVFVSYGDCSYRDTINVFLEPLPELPTLADSLFCDSVDVLMDVGIDGLIYKWSSGIFDTLRYNQFNEPGSYTVSVSNGPCIEYLDFNLRETEKPKLNDAFYCNEFIHEVDLSSIQNKGIQYLWSNQSTEPITTFSSKGAKWVRLKQGDCEYNDTFLITNPSIDLELGNDIHYCDYIDLELDGGSDGIEYNWNTGEQSRYLTVNTTGTYSVEVKDSNNCFKSDTINITLSQSPKLDLGGDTTICKNSPIVIQGPPYFDYLWSTGSSNQDIIVSNEGVYTLTITDSLNCFATDNIKVIVDPEAYPSELYIPNAFTPNANGLNDFFPYKTEIIQFDYSLEIYNRWGQRVFASKKENWGGLYKGKPAPQGAYIYFIYYNGCDGKIRSRKGTFYLLN
ncbi:MAG: gliding motility-associated C-terminal domain-containing protein [Bacteroidia bacterium]